MKPTLGRVSDSISADIEVNTLEDILKILEDHGTGQGLVLDVKDGVLEVVIYDDYME
jgi:hypothetical protein